MRNGTNKTTTFWRRTHNQVNHEDSVSHNTPVVLLIVKSGKSIGDYRVKIKSTKQKGKIYCHLRIDQYFVTLKKFVMDTVRFL